MESVPTCQNINALLTFSTETGSVIGTCSLQDQGSVHNMQNNYVLEHTFIIIIINPLTARVVEAPQIILQPVFSIFLCWTCRTPGLSIPWCCPPTSSSVFLVFFPLSLCLARWLWPDLMNGKHDHTTAVCVSLQSSKVFMWFYCLLDLGTDFLTGNMVFVWDA